jgi:hypothetical protein
MEWIQGKLTNAITSVRDKLADQAAIARIASETPSYVHCRTGSLFQFLRAIMIIQQVQTTWRRKGLQNSPLLSSNL